MFNYKSLRENKSIDKNITIPQLIRTIKDNPNKASIEEVRRLRADGDEAYKKLKDQLPVFVPNGIFETKLEHSNFKHGTGYYYLDIDDETIDAYELKSQFLDKYRESVYLCWVSASLGGIGILVKLDDVLTHVGDFKCLYTYLTKEVFPDYNFDNKVTNAGRINFISQDEDLFINNDSLIEISNVDLSIYSDKPTKKKVSNNNDLKGYSNHSGMIPFQDKKNYSGILLHTNLNWEKDEFIKFQPVEDYLDCRIYNKVHDGKKRSMFTQLIPKLFELNGIEKESEILSQVIYVNEYHTMDPIPEKDLLKLFNSISKDYQAGKLKAIGKPKYIHLNPSIKHCKSAKHAIRNRLAGYAKRLRTQARIEEAMEKLIAEGKKATQNNVAQITNLSIATVKRYWNLGSLEMDYFDELVSMTNRDFKENKSNYYDRDFMDKEIHSTIEEMDYTIDEETGEVFHNGVLDSHHQDETIPAIDNTPEETGADNGEVNNNPFNIIRNRLYEPKAI